MAYSRPSGAYAGTTGSNKTKYQNDSAAVPKVAISSAKVDGDFNYLIDAVNTLETSIGAIVGVTDGDKGSITVSSSGTVWTLDDSAVTTAKLANNAVTLAKQANGTANRLQGFNASGVASEVSIGSGLSLSGGSLSATATGGEVEAITRVAGSGQTTTSTSFVDVTGHTVSLTPASTSKKVRVRVDVLCGWSAAPSGAVGYGQLLIARSDGTEVGRAYVDEQATGGVAKYSMMSFEVEDSPATASSITYKLQFARSGNGTFHITSTQTGSYKNTMTARTVN